MADFEKLKQAMGDLDEDQVIQLLKTVMEEDQSQAQEAMTACQDGMNMVGKRFETGEYFVGDLIYAGELMTQAVDILKPALTSSVTAAAGKALLCTVAGDLHDIGKNIVRAMLEAAGIEVIDLGIDVPPSQIVHAVKEHDIHVVLLSGVLTLAIDSMKATVDAIIAEGLRDQVKIMIGGAPANDGTQQLTGADDWACNPQKTVQVSQEWLKLFNAQGGK